MENSTKVNTQSHPFRAFANRSSQAVSVGQPTSARRALCAVSIGLAAAALSLTLSVSDFDQLWFAGNAVRAGTDPYAVLHGSFWHDLYYPLTAVVVAIPTTVLPRVEAHALFAGLGMAAAAYAVSSMGWWALIGLASYPALNAVQLAQWSPYFVAAALIPYLDWLLLVKPTTGAATVAAFAFDRPARALALSALVSSALIGASFLVEPDWPARWFSATRSAVHIAAPFVRPAGFILLAALLRWRLPEARLLALLCVLPQTMAPYEALLLILALRSRREALVFALSSYAMLPFLSTVEKAGSLAQRIQHDAPVLLLFLYLPVLIMVLRRPNVGRVPDRVERMATILPEWLRGVRALP